MSKQIFYLAGPIWAEQDKGASWRERLKPLLWAHGHDYRDPLDKPNDAQTVPTLKELRRLGKHKEAQRYARMEVIGPDLQLVKESTVVLAVFTKDTLDKIKWSVGTVCEMFYAYHTLDIPVILVIENGTMTDYYHQCGAFIEGIVDKVYFSLDYFLEELE